jgi:hypothetical protein
MSDAPTADEPIVHHADDLYNRIYFLYQVIIDTQNTVRFLDTKAGFCVTLLSGMAAVSLQHQGVRPAVHHILYALFMTAEVCSILVCLRVIFPTIKPHINNGPPAKPRFYIAHNKAHHWVMHTLANPKDNILSESKLSYIESLQQATDKDLLASLSEAVLTLAFIRQVKSDRLHTAMFCLTASVLLFAAVILVG